MLIDYLNILAVVVIVFNLAFLLSIPLRDNSVVDPFWGISFIVATLYGYFAFGESNIYQVIVTGLILLWGVRLSIRLLVRNWGKGEDFRYAKWRDEWSKQWFYLRSWSQVFMLQAILCFLILLPAAFIYINQPQFSQVSLANLNGWLLLFGLMIWLKGFFFEVVGDYQLDRFMKRSDREDGEVLSSGLWSYTRHPNYFGEATMWWGIWLIAVSVDLSAWWSIISPIGITYLLLKVSGVPMLEEKMGKNPEYREYMKETNKFIPSPPKKLLKNSNRE